MNLMMSLATGSRVRCLALVAIVAGLLGFPGSAAETKIYLDIPGVSGDVTDRGYQNQIEIISYSYVLDLNGGGSMTVVKYADSSSPSLFALTIAGTILKRATLRDVLVGSDGKVDTKRTIDLRDVLISSYQTGGSGGGEIPTESVTFNFAKVSVHYNDPGKKGGT
jgi:type VI secretion system secreted protein Hcp